jgi:hypothetical protein
MFCKLIIFMGYWMTIKRFCYLFRKGAKFRNFAYLEGIFNTWNSKTMTNVQNTAGPAYYSVQHLIVSGNLLSNKIMCPLLFLIYTCSTFLCFFLLEEYDVLEAQLNKSNFCFFICSRHSRQTRLEVKIYYRHLGSWLKCKLNNVLCTCSSYIKWTKTKIS